MCELHVGQWSVHVCQKSKEVLVQLFSSKWHWCVSKNFQCPQSSSQGKIPKVTHVSACYRGQRTTIFYFLTCVLNTGVPDYIKVWPIWTLVSYLQPPLPHFSCTMTWTCIFLKSLRTCQVPVVLLNTCASFFLLWQVCAPKCFQKYFQGHIWWSTFTTLFYTAPLHVNHNKAHF